jgi:hypothetical protein
MADSARSYIVTAIAVIIGGLIFLSPKEKADKTAKTEAPPVKRGLKWDIENSSSIRPDDRRLFLAATSKVLSQFGP